MFYSKLFIFQIFVNRQGGFFACAHGGYYGGCAGYDVAARKYAGDGRCAVFICNDVAALVGFKVVRGLF